jgi:SNF2 family DNA or RNA helicase
VFDELQKAKNPRSLISHSTKILNTDFALGLRGTPVENSLSDLWTIMDILSPRRLKDLKTFMDNYPELNSDDPEAGLEKLRSLAK